VIVVDSSVWIDFLRGADGSTTTTVRRLISSNAPLVTTEMVVMELLAGAPSETAAEALREFIFAFPMLATEGLPDFEQAAAIFRACRRGGTTIRTMTDCFIAAVAIRAQAQVLHKDRDFDVIARHTPLQIHPLDA
jgi:hypothetical protein